MNRHVVEFGVIDGGQIKAKEVVQDQVKLVGSKEMYQIVNQRLVNQEYEIDTDFNIFRHGGPALFNIFRWRYNFLMAHLHRNRPTDRLYFGFLVTQCFDQIINNLESSTTVTVEIDLVIANDVNVKLYFPVKGLFFLLRLHNNKCCMNTNHQLEPCHCRLCRDRVWELKNMVDYDHRVAANVEAKVQAFFQRLPSLKDVCIERVVELGLEQGGLPATAQ